MSRRNRQRYDENPFDEQNERESQTPRRSRPARRRKLPYILLFLLVLIALLPNIIGWTGLHQKGINYALGKSNAKVVVRQASFGWFQPVTLLGVTVHDEKGAELLTAEKIATSKNLLQFASTWFRGNDFGAVDIQSPVVLLDLRADGSNLEDALASFTKSSSSQQSPATESQQQESALPKIVLNLRDGKAMITSQSDPGFGWQIDQLNTTLQTMTEQAPVDVDASFVVAQYAIAQDGKTQLVQSGSMALKSQVDPGATVLKMGGVDLALKSDKLPMSLVAPLAQRFIGPARSSGELSTELHSRLDLNTLVMDLDVKSCQANDIRLVAPQLLGQDQLEVRNLNASGMLKVSPKQISSSNFEVQSDFGKIQSNGSFEVDQLAKLASDGKLLSEPLELNGEIDLAGLVRMLPATLKLHPDLDVDSGLISFQANTRNENGQHRLVVNADASNLKGRRGKQAIVWQNPLHLGAVVRQSGNQLALESIQCDTDFLRIAGTATLESGSFAMKGDLNRMRERVGEFVDLAGMDFEGQLDGKFGWQAAEGVSLTSATPLPLQMGGQIEVANPVIKLPDLPVWKPEQLIMKFSGSGEAKLDSTSGTHAITVQSGGARIDIGNENATAMLAAPWSLNADTIQLNLDVNGRLEGWLGHVRNFVDMGDLQGDGDVSLQGLTELKGNQVRFSNVQYAVKELDFKGYGVKVQEPSVSGTVDGNLDMKLGQLNVNDVTLVSNALAARGERIRVAFADKLLADGGIAFRGDVNRLAQWFELSTRPDSVYWFGGAEGTVQFASSPQGTAGQISASLVDLIAAQQQMVADPQSGAQKNQWVELYRDAKVQIDSQLTLASDFNSVQLQNAKLNSSAINMEMSGSVSDISNSLLMDLNGKWNPSWDKVSGLLAAYTGNVVKLSGSGSRPFSIRGPLLGDPNGVDANSKAWVPAQLEASLTTGWDQGSFLEVPIGASEITVDIKNSVGYVGTKGIAFSGGLIKIAPVVDMRTENPVMVMQPTRVIDNVALTEDTARKWLKFVAPLVADATSAQGNLTMDIESLQMPLLNPLAVEATGTIQLANVVVGAGPLADQLLGAVQQVRTLLKPDAEQKDLKTWLQLNQQSIPYIIRDQKVFHENVNIVVKDITITTSGAVGFDQSLQMMAEIPIADDWIQGKQYLAGLKGQKLRIPIGGTVTRPQLDQRAIQGLSAELARSAATGALSSAITEKLAPKATEIQGQINSKVSGELNKFQERLGEKLGGQLPNLGGGLPNFGQGTQNSGGGNMGADPKGANIDAGSAGQGNPAGGNPTGGSGQTLDGLGKSMEGELKKGIGDLFKRKNGP